MQLKIGTNRLVIVGKKFAYKIPLFFRGVKANRQEYTNALGKDYVAKTEKKWYGLKQERLNNLVTLPYKYDGEIPDDWKELWKHTVHNRFQVGQDESGAWKFFDYEQTKWDKSFKREVKQNG